MVQFYLKDRGAFEDAAELMRAFGDAAAFEAAVRADRSRCRGNVLNFCHWRQIERAIASLRDEDVTGIVH